MPQLQGANPILLTLSIVLQLFAFVMGAYYVLVSLFAWIPKRKIPDVSNKTHSFAMVVAAHNEEAVIKYMVESLKKQKYDRDAYDIFVVADNCTDNTAKVARDAGAIVYERTNAELRGKGHALEWIFAKIFELERKYDAISIFDADNVVDPMFLHEINCQFNKGYKVVQGKIDSKNPFDTWVSCAYSISFWAVSRLYQLARNNINLTCQLSGTGFAVDCDIIKEYGWGATCLTEDLEFTSKLVLNNEAVGWAHEAIVYDEKPLTITQSWRQRVRWMQGHADVASRFFFKLLKKAFKERNFNALDCAVYLLQPVKILVLGAITLMALIQSIYPSGNIGFFQMSYLFKSSLVWWIVMLADFIYVPLAVTIEKKTLNLRLIFGYATNFLYTLTWVPITIQGFLKKNNREWFHTQHTRTIDISEMEKV